VTVTLAGCTTQGRSPVESVTRATAVATPATVAPVAPVAPTAPPAPAAPAAPAATGEAPPTAAPLSPLAAALGPRLSVLPETGSARPAPVSLSIDRLALTDLPVVPVGVDDDGQLAVPDERSVGWYELGARPGEPGATVLASHVSWNRKRGLFEQLGRLEPGDRAAVSTADGATRTYEVVERTMFDKTGLPPERVWTREGPETLVLITCGGAYDAKARRYADNIVVFAVPVA